MGNTQLFRNTYLFAGLVFLTLLLIAITNRYILTSEFYERSGELVSGANREDTVLYQYFQSSLYLWAIVYLSVKIACIVVVLSIATFVLRLNIAISHVVGTVLIAEYVFLIPAILKIGWFLYHYPNGNLQDWHNCYPLSALSLLSGAPAAWIYPLQTLNLFEILYWFVLAGGIQRGSNINFDHALQVVLKSYVPALAVWTAIIVTATISFFPQSA